MREYQVRYHDKRGSEHLMIKSDGENIYFRLRDIDFEGSSFDILTGDIDFNKFDYELFEDPQGDLTNYSLDVQIPIQLEDRSTADARVFTEIVACHIEVGEQFKTEGLGNINGLQLTTSFGTFTVDDKIEWFEDTLVALQKQLPDNIYLKTCISCKYSNYHPVGNGMFGSLCCFKNYKKELLRFRDKHDLMALWTGERVKDESLFFVQETFDCTEHQLPTEEDWYYKNWIKTID